ncbi:hypothetical protein VISI1226_18466 [Vibrio sinaloensis DSM 21326]|uniref:Lipoprotein n=1 Tax=Vibrio sinaloensis DSM 21326 TaxID=945550 RepID=E8MCB7_PHOS4|nr:hypothetical protein [Vibrio sinaloensis]EGA68285.1 hypothetical protein VISI1226_18466 [Vibrio sinaloensis DSM 21326]
MQTLTKSMVLTGMMLFTISGCAELKQAGSDIGHATKDATTAIGHAARDTTKAIGHASRDAVNSVKDDLSSED